MAWTEKYANFDLTTGDNDGSSEANAWQTPSAMTTGIGATVSVPTLINIKRQAVAYDLTASQTWTPAGTALCPLWYRGYATTPGDGGLWEVRYNAGGTVSLTISGAYCTVDGVAFLPGVTTGYSGLLVSGAPSTMIRCVVDSRSVDTANAWNIINCDFILHKCTLVTGGTNLGPCVVAGNRILVADSTGRTEAAKIDLFGRYVIFTANTVIGNGASGFNGLFLDRADSCRGMYIAQNTFHNFASAIKIDEEPNALAEVGTITGNVFDTMAAYGVERTNTEAGYLNILKNYYRACTSGLTNYTEASTLTNTALTASPFVDAANGDFRLNETAGGGAVLRAAGFPVNYPYDWTNMTNQSVYEGPSPADIAAAIWARTGRTLTS